jgi:dimethylglycine dehydrogenase
VPLPPGPRRLDRRLLLERNELTAGSTWHAAGNVPTFSSSWSIMNMQRYSAQLYRGLGAAVGYPMNYHVTGSVRLGHTRERLREFQRVVGMGRYQGMDLDILARPDPRPLPVPRDPRPDRRALRPQ